MRLIRLFSAACLVMLSGHASASFVETFTDGAAASRWGVVIGASTGVVDDATADLAFDYSTLGLTNPNGSSETTGAYMQFNITSQGGGSSAEASSAAIYPLGVSFDGAFTLELDMNIYYGGGTGSTEHGFVGVLDPNDPLAPHRYSLPGGPLAFAYASDDGSASYGLHGYWDGDAASSGIHAISDYTDVTAGTITDFETGISNAAGPGFGNWVKVRLESDGTTINWYLNGSLAGSYDNTAGTYTEGSILIGGTDLYSSVNDVSGVVVDNVVFSAVPEPGSLVLLGSMVVGSLALLRKRSQG